MRRIITAVAIVFMLVLLAFIFKNQIKRFISFWPHISMETKLPAPALHSNTSIEEALSQRRSIREYKNDPLTLAEIGQLLWAAQGITSSSSLRTAPSAGALYPLEIYLVSGNVTQLAPGIYRYIPADHALEKVVDGDKRNELMQAALSQVSVRNGAADIIITANYAHTEQKYGTRGERFVQLEAGHVAENVCLQTVSLHLGTVTVGEFDDQAVKKILNSQEEPLYILPVGKI